MINLTTNVDQNNIRKWSVKKFDSEAGTARLVFESNAGQTILEVQALVDGWVAAELTGT
jgi:hypothetical protein